MIKESILKIKQKVRAPAEHTTLEHLQEWRVNYFDTPPSVRHVFGRSEAASARPK